MTVERRPNPKLSDLDRSMARLFRRKVFIGIPADAKSADGKVSNAVIGYVQEHGDDALHIPARPFLEPGVRDAAPRISALLKTAAAAAIRNDQAGVDRAMEAIGLICQASVKQKMVSGPFASLAPETLYKRRHRGGMKTMSTTPLIDTRSLFNSITYVLGEN